MQSKRQEFMDTYINVINPSHLVVAVKLPDGNVELIVNQSSAIENKMKYYMAAYDENLCLNTNPSIQIVSYMVV